MLVLIVLILGFGAFIVLVLIPNFANETQFLFSKLPDYIKFLRQLATKLHSRWNFLPDISTGLDQLRNYLLGILISVPLLFSQTFGRITEVIGTIILSLYMAYDPNSVIKASYG